MQVTEADTGNLLQMAFFLSPLKTNLINEHNVVALSNSDLLRVRRKFQASDEVALLAFIWWLGRELIFFVSIVIEQVDRLNKETITLSAAPTAIFLPEGAQVMAATFFMLSSKGMMFPEYLNFIQNLNDKWTSIPHLNNKV